MGKAKDKAVKVKKATGGSEATGDKGKAANGIKGGKSKLKKGKGESGGFSYGDPLERELGSVGLRINKITADGNCLFRSVGDQMHGDEGRHIELRQGTCDLMVERREAFEPFVEDDQGFETYIKRMRKDGVWGGHMELQALSLLTGANIYVYQQGQPRWTVSNHPDGSPSIHLSYHGGEHYNSVRLLDDYGRGPPKPITLGGGGVTAAQHAKERVTWTAADEARVAANTGCDSPALVQHALKEAAGDVDAAIERVIEAMARDGGNGDTDDCEGRQAARAGSGSEDGHDARQQQTQQQQAEGSAEADQPPSIPKGSNMCKVASDEPGVGVAAGFASQEEAASGSEDDRQHAGHGTSSSGDANAAPDAKAAEPAACGKARQKGKKGVAVGPSSSSAAAKKPPRNKACPCGSGRKWKSCCGVATAAKERRLRALKEAAPAALDPDGALPIVLATLHI